MSRIDHDGRAFLQDFKASRPFDARKSTVDGFITDRKRILAKKI
jgi:hypothetical protein